MKHQMKVVATLFLSIIMFMACQSGGKEETTTDESTPGPVSDMDKSRYNLNAADEILYGTTDTLKKDSLEAVDSMQKRDSL